jgi:hypothetical protein
MRGDVHARGAPQDLEEREERRGRAKAAKVVCGDVGRECGAR